jgi:hypothetical protein
MAQARPFLELLQACLEYRSGADAPLGDVGPPAG